MSLKNIAIILNLTFISTLSAAVNPWDKTITQVTDSIVSIRVNAVRTFDTETSKVTQATGFVVDAERGIILTNRHVVNPGPVTADAVFSNNEEIEIKAIYRDPVHDFGFFQYDPKQLKFIHPKTLHLKPKLAKVGDEIKIIGNDSGEHMSILSGTLARLDRSAPQYQRGGYNDFNTFYFQSSADTSGGSSGAPVINQEGHVVALNAGANNRSSSSFFLPLYKITRALKAIQEGAPIHRGTVQATFDHIPYDQARRFKLSAEIEKEFRDSNQSNGLLVVTNTVKLGAADNKLLPGDIIISAQSSTQSLKNINRYEVLEIFFDEHVNQTVEVTISRLGELLTIPLLVENLHDITPDEFLELASGTFNNFSYQLARQTNLAAQGVYIANSGYMFGKVGINRGSVIQTINNIPVNNLDDFQSALSKLKQNEEFVVKYVSIGSPHLQQVSNAKFQTNWHLSQRCKRDDKQGVWPCEEIHWNSETKQPTSTRIQSLNYSDKYTQKIASSLVLVRASLPYHIDGQNYEHYSGTGLILDAKKGLVLADRNTVPIKMSDVNLTIAGIAEIPAKVVFVHPVHSYVLLEYDTKLLKGHQLKSAPLKSEPLEAGDSAWLIGYQSSNRLISERVNISSFEALSLPSPSVPRFRDANTNAITVNNPPLVASGVLLDKKGYVRAWWSNFELGNGETLDRGLPIKTIVSIRDQWLKKSSIDIYSIGAEFHPITLANAKKFGLNQSWMNKLQDVDNKPQVLKVIRRIAGSQAYDKLKDGDLLLAINDDVVETFEQLESKSNQPTVKISVWRDNQQLDYTIKTSRLSERGTEDIYLWSGALLQKPHRSLAVQHGIEPNGVYISWYWYGSPANRFNLSPLKRITELQGEKVENLEQFIKLTKKYSSDEYLSIRLVDIIGRESIISLKPDLRYWPTQRVFWDGEHWQNQLIK